MYLETPVTPQSPHLSTDPRLLDSIDYFLMEISGKVQVSKGRREKAEGHYDAIGNVLKNSPENTLLYQLDVTMIPFGGFGTNTPVHPHLKDEFDLDLIVRFKTGTQRFGTPERLYNEVFNRLDNHETYKGKLEKKDRCVGVNYAGDFHLDLMPAVLYAPIDISTKLWIPERQKDGTYRFVLTDPMGLTKWFEDRCALEKRDLTKLSKVRNSFEMMPLVSEEARKPKLKQAVQLIKRMRDVFFYNDPECKKILKSVIILTVAGECYAGETDLYSLVKKILFNLDIRTRDIATAQVSNPVHLEENFLLSMKSKPHRHEKLRNFIATMRACWSSLLIPNEDLEHTQNLLKKLFGESVTEEVLYNYGKIMSDRNNQGFSKMLKGGAIVASANGGSKIGGRQFFGDR